MVFLVKLDRESFVHPPMPNIHVRALELVILFLPRSNFPSIIHALVLCWLPGRDDGPTKCPGQRAAGTMYAALVLPLPDSFTVSLHGPNGRHYPAVWTVQGDCLETVTVAFGKTVGIPIGYVIPECLATVAPPIYIHTSQSYRVDAGQLKVMLRQSADSPTVSRLRLFNRL